MGDGPAHGEAFAPSTDGGGNGVRVRVDHDSCSGTAHCQQSMPAMFVVVNRKSHVRADVDWSTVDIARLREAEQGCPWFAISVVEEPVVEEPVVEEPVAIESEGI